jgi:hypothetical protein
MVEATATYLMDEDATTTDFEHETFGYFLSTAVTMLDLVMIQMP